MKDAILSRARFRPRQSIIMPQPLRFTVHERCRSTRARLGRVETPHGGFDTPVFMPVGTQAAVKGLLPSLVHQTGTQILLNNAFHLMLRPGAERIDQLGGVHQFMRWDGPILTDSGGYQAFSLAELNSIDDDGVTFASIVDGAKVRLTPERAIEVQNLLGADIIMAFDDCPPSADAGGEASEADEPGQAAAPRRSAARRGIDPAVRLRFANERTIRWLERCKAAHRRADDQALFGIVQGGTDLELRRQAAQQVCNVELPGYAIGGVAVGESPAMIHRVVEFTAPLLPEGKPRYLMGVGYERDLVAAVRAGVDMFDCVLPTRNGRTGNAFTRTGQLHLRNARFGDDQAALQADCDCTACAGGFSRAYLRHLFQAKEMLGPILLSLHNIRHFQRLMLDIRRAIREDCWLSLSRSWPVLESAEPAAMPEPRDLE
jgi:queuine tRNA-ribosyltransferase